MCPFAQYIFTGLFYVYTFNTAEKTLKKGKKKFSERVK